MDSDLDGHPDQTLPCTDWGCFRVSILRFIVDIFSGNIFYVDCRQIFPEFTCKNLFCQ